MVRTTLTSLAISEKISMSFPGIFSVRAVSSRFLAARSHRSALRSFKFRDILSKNVAGSKSRYQVIEFTLIVVLSIAIGFVLFAQGDTVQYSLARILSFHCPLPKLIEIVSKNKITQGLAQKKYNASISHFTYLLFLLCSSFFFLYLLPHIFHVLSGFS